MGDQETANGANPDYRGSDNVFAYTALGADGPAFISINRMEGVVGLRVAVRSDKAQIPSEIELGAIETDRFLLAIAAYGQFPVLTQSEIDKLVGDNAMLQRGLDEANTAIANLQMKLNDAGDEIGELRQRQGEMKIPASLSNVQTRDVKDLPRLDQLQPHPGMAEPAVEVDNRTDVEKHLAAKAAARDLPMQATDGGPNPDYVEEIEGAKS